MSKKNYFILLVAMCLVIALTGHAFASSFTDIEGHWAENQINDWAQKGLASGYSDGTFRPGNEVTRAEFVSLTNRAFGFTEIGTASGFDDVEPGDWYYESVLTAQSAGYIGGYTDGTFKPNQTISRQEVASILVRLMGLDPTTTGLTQFADYDQMSEWARGSIGAVVQNGLMLGMPDNTFGPVKSITRAEAVVSLDRALDFKQPVKVESAIEGTVTLDGKAEKDVIIRIFEAGSYEVLEEIETNANGYFKVELEPGDYDVTAVTDSEVAYESDVTVSENKVATSDLALEDGAVISGKLVDKDERDVEDATILFTTNPTFVATTDDDGEYTIAVLPDRTYTVRAYEPGEEDEEPEVVEKSFDVGSAGSYEVDAFQASFSVGSSFGGGGGSGSSDSDSTPDVSINPIDDVTITSGSTRTIAVTTSPSDATVSASSDDTNVASVELSGNDITITAKSAGSATITVTASKSEYNDATETFDVTVNAAALKTPIAVSGDTIIEFVGEIN